VIRKEWRRSRLDQLGTTAEIRHKLLVPWVQVEIAKDVPVGAA